MDTCTHTLTCIQYIHHTHVKRNEDSPFQSPAGSYWLLRFSFSKLTSEAFTKSATRNTSPWKDEQDHEFEVILGSRRPCLRKTTKAKAQWGGGNKKMLENLWPSISDSAYCFSTTFQEPGRRDKGPQSVPWTKFSFWRQLPDSSSFQKMKLTI